MDDNDRYGKTSLHRASIDGHVEVVSYLLDQGANINKEGQLRSTPLIYIPVKWVVI